MGDAEDLMTRELQVVEEAVANLWRNNGDRQRPHSRGDAATNRGDECSFLQSRPPVDASSSTFAVTGAVRRGSVAPDLLADRWWGLPPRSAAKAGPQRNPALAGEWDYRPRRWN
jgi:hypothetical protein